MSQTISIEFHRFIGRGAVALLLALCMSCANQNPSPATQKPPLGDADRARVQALIYDAQDAMANNRLSYPTAGSAKFLFEQALVIDPTNVDAARGLEQIIERYIALALAAAKRSDVRTAGDMLAKARQIDPEHPSINPTAVFIQTADRSRRTTRIVRGLSKATLDLTIDSLLRDIKPGCRFKISAASDAETRRLYQALRKGFARNAINRRPRAASEISTPDRLERFCELEDD